MTTIKRLALGLMAGAALATSAQAGGFSRGSANLDGLYASEYVNEPIISSLGVTFVSPGRSYDTEQVRNPLTGQFETTRGYEFSQDFAVPFASLGLQFGDRGQCVGSYSQPYGADSENQGPARFYIASQQIETFELGATCSVGFDVGRGRAYAIGGVFYESLRYQQARDFNAFPIAGAALGAGPGLSTIDVTSDDVGFRLGAAYEIPEIALKAQVLYRSETEHAVEGRFDNVPFAGIFGSRAQALGQQAAAAFMAGDIALGQELQAQAQQQQAFAITSFLGNIRSARAFGNATLPRQLELNVQSGVAPGTLVFGSVKWTDWSVVQEIDLLDGISNAPFTEFTGNFRDGYTVTLGVGRAFTEELAGSLSVTYDRGVGTGFDTFSDTYTVASGFAYDVNEIATLRAGGAVIYFTEGDQLLSEDTRRTSPSEFGYALSTSLSIKF